MNEFISFHLGFHENADYKKAEMYNKDMCNYYNDFATGPYNTIWFTR
jgi:hypothetical protein